MSIIDLFLPTSKFTPFGLPCKKCTLIFLLIFPFLDVNKALPHSPESAGETCRRKGFCFLISACSLAGSLSMSLSAVPDSWNALSFSIVWL